jgi:hypothetical protein
VGPRTGLDVVEKRKCLPLPGLELRPLSRPARSQSLYRLRYPNYLANLALNPRKRKSINVELRFYQRLILLRKCEVVNSSSSSLYFVV